MPYKDPERKRQWEREHREERNAQRRQRQLIAQNISAAQKRSPDPVLSEDSGNAWGVVAAITVGVGILVLSAIAG